jgi:hypothetical protein
MSILRCPREAELKAQMELGHWPEASAAELREHVAACGSCRDTVVLRQSFRAARAASIEGVQLPPAGLLWWRAQLRRRNEALTRVQRPIVGAQIFALAITALIAAGIAIAQAKPGFLWMKGTWDSFAEQLPRLWGATNLWSSAWSSVWSGASLAYLVPGIGMLVLVGAAAYLSLEKQ